MAIPDDVDVDVDKLPLRSFPDVPPGVGKDERRDDISVGPLRYALVLYAPASVFAALVIAEVVFEGAPPVIMLPALLVAAFAYAFGKQFKRVALLDDCLIISDRRREVHVPAWKISRVSRAWTYNPPTIVIELTEDSPMGRKILFIPVERGPFPRNREGGLVERLRRLARDAKRAPCRHRGANDGSELPE